MKLFLKIFFAAMFVWMSVMTIRTSMEVTILEIWPVYAANPWAVATLWDAYCGFSIFFLWTCYKESTIGMRILWFVLIMGLGNIATAAYMLIQLWRLRDDQPAEAVLWRS